MNSGKQGTRVHVWVDGDHVTVDAGVSILDACDAAGHYVPRLCHYPGFPCCEEWGPRTSRDVWEPCGLCVVRLGDGSEVLACATRVSADLDITTDDSGLRTIRLERLAAILARHPHVCLTCPDRDGCSRGECTYGNPPDARCCPEFGRCELGKLVGFIDAAAALPQGAAAVSRDATFEGRIRRETGLCIGCGRCVRVCDTTSEATGVLEMAVVQQPGSDASQRRRVVARPRGGTLRASGCSFCGLCVLVCPAGALTAPGEAGIRWLSSCRERGALAAPVLPPPVGRRLLTEEAVATVPAKAGVVSLLDGVGRVLRIRGAADVRSVLANAMADPDCARATHFQVDFDDLYTQRESELLARHLHETGHLPPGNELADDLFGDDS